MNRSEAGNKAIAESFAAISGVRSFTTFSRLTDEQRECVTIATQNADRIFACKARDLHLKSLVVCVTGYSDCDEDEPVTENCFSQHRFYATYVHELIFFPDRFDFLIHCIINQVCVVQRPSKFKELLATLLHREAERVVPDEVLNYDRLLEEDEEKRIESFTMRKDWRCKVPALEDVTAAAITRHVADMELLRQQNDDNL
eukprot:CAMPEP_0174831568 /NCGR_PEP_ID=MMETSP1114-20130205/3169_1 /TAXON_ID=312471 /ORGANISM="Neobodo designis, Strain CCAP 1951/1" /LENGTH=199 /DNA_ID=CAMNT_0016065395 /DNA_START=32 /DNA_END=631 /DNA_ORIENTATION=-